MSGAHPNGRPGSSRFLPFLEARTTVRSLDFRAPKDYRDWCRSGQRPANVPSNPDTFYSEFVGWPDWLGTAPRPYKEAIAFVHPLGIATRDEWVERYAAGEFPRDIPKWPQNVYDEFTKWSDFLGRKKDFRFRPFDEARQFFRALGLRRRQDHTEFVQSDECPKDIPSDPDRTYAGKGWVNYADYLGLDGARLDRGEVASILRALRGVVRDLTPAELYAVLHRRGVIGHRFATNGNAPVLRALEQLCQVADPDALLERLARDLDGAATAGQDDDQASEAEGDLDVPVGTGTAEEETDEAPNEELLAGSVDEEGDDPWAPPGSQAPSPSHFDGVDAVAEHLVRRDEELLAFLVDKRLDLLWQVAISSGLPAALDLLGEGCGGVHYAAIRRRFLEEYEAADRLPIPAAYTFRSNGEPAPPLLSQKRAALRVLRDCRIGNWSGVGAGKTISAILAAMVVEAKLTIVVAFNSTLEKWRADIKNAYPAARVLVKERGPFAFDPGVPTFLIVNYETFQQPWSDPDLIDQILGRLRVDFIVLDEIHSARQRRERPDVEASARHRRIRRLVFGAGAANPGLRVMAMSATPVVNNLHEARTTLELVIGKDLSDVPTRPTIANAVEYHKLFLRFGIRYRPDYSDRLGEPRVVEVDGMPHLRELMALPRYGYIPPLERVLLRAKLAEIVRHSRPGTLIYTQFVTDMVEPLRQALARVGLSVGVYTGDEKGGLAEFLARQVPGTPGAKDVLIGSAPIGTGVDGLQHVCDQLIFACLPWTRAEFDQVVGRLTRLDGEKGRKVEVIIPEVVLRHQGEEWSWDRRRRRCIEYKRSIADAALDGVIPEGRLPTERELYRQSMASLAAWEVELAPQEDSGGVAGRKGRTDRP